MSQNLIKISFLVLICTRADILVYYNHLRKNNQDVSYAKTLIPLDTKLAIGLKLGHLLQLLETEIHSKKRANR